jgi:hypothetical protein
MSEVKNTAAVTPISSHKRFERKTEPVKAMSWAESLKARNETMEPRALNNEELADMDTIAATAHIRQCAWIISHRHGVLTATEMLRMLSEELLTGFKP